MAQVSHDFDRIIPIHRQNKFASGKKFQGGQQVLASLAYLERTRMQAEYEETGEEAEEKYLVVYWDRQHGLLEVSLLRFADEDCDIPCHRMHFVKLSKTNEVVWDRKNKFSTL